MLNCLIVEDEPLAAEVLTDYIAQVPFLALAGHCADAMKAMDFLHRKPVDVMFLDLHLPGLKGFDFLKTLAARPRVIVTSAYHQYALDGYELDVVDYLVKPVEFSRFLTAVNKLSSPLTLKKEIAQQGSAGFMFVYSDKKRVKIFYSELLFAESEKDYIRIVTKTKTIIIRQTMQEFEKHLPHKQFLRVHRSFIVNCEAIDSYDSSHFDIGGKSIPIGRQYKHKIDRFVGEN